MKVLSRYLLIGLLGGLWMAPGEARAELEVSGSVRIHAASDFHAPLSSHGAWVEVGSYGRCWRPKGVAVGWQPYSQGRWLHTDHGWYWESDEPWSWACYHYGSWAHDPSHGWIWVPGIEWAPAWVYWRAGGGHCGWAPRGPKGVVVAPASFVFVEAKHFHEPITPLRLIVKDSKVIDETTEVGRIKFETRNVGNAMQKVAINEGPGVDLIQKSTGKAVESVSIRNAVERSPRPADMKSAQSEQADKGKPQTSSADSQKQEKTPKPSNGDHPSFKPANKSPGKGSKGKGKG